MKDPRAVQMRWILGLTAVSLVPIYILLGWQMGGHSPRDIPSIFWQLEAGAWGVRAPVESAVLIYMFQTVSRSKILVVFEVALISLIAVTVGLVIIANGNGQALAQGLPGPLYWFWSFSVAAFAPLMMGGVGFAYKAHEVVQAAPNELVKLQAQVAELAEAVKAARTTERTADRRQEVGRLKSEGFSQAKIAGMLGVSIGTIRADVKALNGSGK